MPFIGRTEELAQLEKLRSKKTSSLVVVSGRRRIGKSSLIQHFGQKYKYFFNFQGLAPRAGLTKQYQLQNFSEQISQKFNLPRIDFRDWTEAFAFLAKQVSQHETLVLLDEISWMGSSEPDFPGKLKIAWDTQFKGNEKLILVLCGSVSSWIETNILEDTDFVGRVSLALQINDLPLSDCSKFWGNRSERVANFEKLRILCVTGGIPKYLEELNFSQGADENIQRLCFSKSGYLFRDFERIFNDIFDTRASIYRGILSKILANSLSPIELGLRLGSGTSSSQAKYMRDLELSGFVARDHNYSTEGKQKGFSKYRIKDNYLRFYLKYIAPNKNKIEKGLFKFSSLDTLIAWDTICGYQFKNLVLGELPKLISQLGIVNVGVLSAAPYFQTETSRSKACQIDLLISCKNNTHLVCEIKFKRKIGMEVVAEVKQKIERFKVPRNSTKRPILIYAGALSQEVIDADYFDSIIDVQQFLEE